MLFSNRSASAKSADSGPTKGGRKTDGKVVKKNNADNRAGSTRKLDAVAKARSQGKASAAGNRAGRSGKTSTKR